MAYVRQLPEDELRELITRDMPDLGAPAFVAGPAAGTARVSVVTTAGIHRADDKPFVVREAGYRVIPGDTPAAEIAMSHQSASFDRTGFQQDIDVVLPLMRLRDMARAGRIASVGARHFSFMGAGGLEETTAFAQEVAGMMKEDGINAVLLSPV